MKFVILAVVSLAFSVSCGDSRSDQTIDLGALTVPNEFTTPSDSSLAPSVSGAQESGETEFPSGSIEEIPEAEATATTSSTTTTTTTTTTTLPPAPEYVFPFEGRSVSYPTGHHSYPAVDVFGCGATTVAPTSGVVTQIRTVDLWDPATNNPAHRGGLYVSLVGDDGVRYYFAHFESISVTTGQRVSAGTPLGIMGATGNARNSVCHIHFGISRPCEQPEWQVRRGEIWPQPYLDDWRRGGSASPALEIWAQIMADPEACDRAYAAPHAAAS
jgi:murein DD-endopeptidase MepM/ murein hydrolase activator NlpD